MSPTDYTDFPSDPSELGHMMADDCRERESNMMDPRERADMFAEMAIEQHQDAKHAHREQYREKAYALAVARLMAETLGQDANHPGTARLAADLNGGAK